MKGRIKLVRKYFKLSQVDFASKLNLTQNFISLLETGCRVPSERTLSDICQEFNVNKDWLRTGQGEMFRPVSQNDTLKAYIAGVQALPATDVQVRVLKAMSMMSPSDWTVIENLIDKIAQVKTDEAPYQRDARLLREEADAVEEEGERLSASPLERNA